MGSFSKTSAERLSTCEEYIQKVMNKAIELSPIDFGIAQGDRSVELQKQYFNEGKSKVNPDNYTEEELPLKGKHIVNAIYTKAGAVDIYAYIPGVGASWDLKYLCILYGVIMAIDKSMENRMRCGINWDSDGIVITDQSFLDAPHYEMIIRTKG